MQQKQTTNNVKRSLNFRFFEEIIGELRRVTWPTMNETMRLTMLVLAVAAFLGVLLGIADLVFGWVFGIIL
tara:strand:- start:936 stop:1148 length:213 start_codon:yes stop_codon:yes gene_type:complete